jgi:hypothetical protein
MMQAREEREAIILRSSLDPVHPAPAGPVTSQLASEIGAEFTQQGGAHLSAPEEPPDVNRDSRNISTSSSPQIQVASVDSVTETTSTIRAGAHPAQTPYPPNNALPAQSSDPPTSTLTSILNSLHEAVSDLQYAVTGSEKRTDQGTKSRPFKVRQFGLKKDQAGRDPFAGM